MDKQSVLREKFGYFSFRTGQEETIDAILDGTDVLAVMPTGAGKSLCYQIPALLLDGMTIVISPLISLMKDQVASLREAGCQAAFLNSSLNAREYADTMNEILSGRVKLLYIAPERLQREEMPQFAANSGIPLVVVDEAHCVSQWGHDFRTSYLQIADFIGSIDPRPAVAAFTATATVRVQEDIHRLLALRNPFVINTGFDRPNLYFEVQKTKDKKTALLKCLEKRKKSSGIIYCATRKAVQDVCHLLISHGYDATRYHAGLDDDERRKNQDDFIYDRKTVMVATNAFGMGIDKSNVSFVIHYNMPKNIESYYQEAGRAGRDGECADCILLYSGQDVLINQYLITHNEESESADNSQQALRAHNIELLKQMTFYASGNNCLRRSLLSYFGEHAPVNCGNCSNCLMEFDETDVTVEAQKIASCVYRLKQRGRSFGKITITNILRGSKNEKIRRFDLENISTWGIMSDASVHRIRMILDFMIDEGYLVLEDGEFRKTSNKTGDAFDSTGKYQVVTLGNANELFRGDARLIMKLPKESRKNSEAGNLPLTSAYADDAEINEILFDKLRKLRKGIAEKESVPAYIVFPDSSLREMCLKRPVSLAQFSGISGVGRVKLEKYGERFTTFIREYLENL